MLKIFYNFLRTVIPRYWIVRILEIANLHQIPSSPKSHPLVLIFPSDRISGWASHLRARAIASPLTNLGWRCAVVHTYLDLDARRRLIARSKPSVLLFQKTRHPLNDPALYPQTPSVADIDDADFFHEGQAELVSQRVAKAQGIVAGSRFVANYFAPLGIKSTVVWTGGYLGHEKCKVSCDQRDAQVAWGISSFGSYPIERAFVLDTATRIAKLFGPYTLVLYGVGNRSEVDKFLPPLASAGVRVKWVGLLRYDQFLKHLESSAVGLAPLCMEHPFSRGKSFGKIIAYLAAECAIVATPVVDHPLFFRDGENGFLRDNDPDDWAAIVAELLRDPKRRAQVTAQAKQDYVAHLSTRAAAEKLDRFLREVVTA